MRVRTRKVNVSYECPLDHTIPIHLRDDDIEDLLRYEFSRKYKKLNVAEWVIFSIDYKLTHHANRSLFAVDDVFIRG